VTHKKGETYLHSLIGRDKVWITLIE